MRCRVFDRQQRRRSVAVGDDEAKVRAERAERSDCSDTS
ncbi:hypothetical protein I553_10625 [Mycobacterium xenopi 4042]|uniref:Uncharacterized protein n=1 Tax=Mycobacterium xenopi 4042 TaxID=1299334 RepID=X7ZDD4_MYCXE|nr:hypothetical protein I553_10625 [Mycobacterium xenopi 4042]